MGGDWLIALAVLVYIWWFRRRIQYKVAERAVRIAELVSKCEGDVGNGSLTGGQKKKLAADDFYRRVPLIFMPLTVIELDQIIEKALQRLKRRGNLD